MLMCLSLEQQHMSKFSYSQYMVVVKGSNSLVTQGDTGCLVHILIDARNGT